MKYLPLLSLTFVAHLHAATTEICADKVRARTIFTRMVREALGGGVIGEPVVERLIASAELFNPADGLTPDTLNIQWRKGFERELRKIPPAQFAREKGELARVLAAYRRERELSDQAVADTRRILHPGSAEDFRVKTLTGTPELAWHRGPRDQDLLVVYTGQQLNVQIFQPRKSQAVIDRTWGAADQSARWAARPLWIGNDKMYVLGSVNEGDGQKILLHEVFSGETWPLSVDRSASELALDLTPDGRVAVIFRVGKAQYVVYELKDNTLSFVRSLPMGEGRKVTAYRWPGQRLHLSVRHREGELRVYEPALTDQPVATLKVAPKSEHDLKWDRDGSLTRTSAGIYVFAESFRTHPLRFCFSDNRPPLTAPEFKGEVEFSAWLESPGELRYAVVNSAANSIFVYKIPQLVSEAKPRLLERLFGKPAPAVSALAAEFKIDNLNFSAGFVRLFEWRQLEDRRYFIVRDTTQAHVLDVTLPDQAKEVFVTPTETTGHFEKLPELVHLPHANRLVAVEGQMPDEVRVTDLADPTQTQTLEFHPDPQNYRVAGVSPVYFLKSDLPVFAQITHPVHGAWSLRVVELELEVR